MRSFGRSKIPEEFASYEAAAEFWDAHDTTDYLDSFKTVLLETKLQQRRFEVEIDEDLMQVLYQQAQQQGVGVSQLVNNVLRKTLGDEHKSSDFGYTHLTFYGY